MKKLRFLISVLLTLALILSASTFAFAQTSLKVSLGEKIGELDRNYVQTWSGMLVASEDDKWAVLDTLGENKLGRTFDSLNTLVGDEAYLVGYDRSQEPNPLSLFKADGTVLIENAAIIEPSSVNDRYLEVSFAGEEVKKEEDCFLYSTDADGEKTMYAGYSQVYDKQEGRFVEGLRIDLVRDDFLFLGDNILLVRGSWEEMNELYRPDGSQVATVEEYPVGRFFVIYTEDGRLSLQDENLNELCELEFNPDSVYADGKLFASKGEDDGFRLINAAGEAVSELVFDLDPEEYGNFLYGPDADDNYAVLTLTGETILDFSDQVDWVRELDHGFLSIEYKDGSFALLYPDGSLAELQEEIDSELFSLNSDEDEVFLLGEGSYRKMEGSIDSLGDLLFKVTNEEGLEGLYSLVDGQELLPQIYADIDCANGCVYAQRDSDGVYEIYPISITE